MKSLFGIVLMLLWSRGNCLNCYTPSLSPGNCVSIQSCPALTEMLQQYYQTSDVRIANYIQHSYCGQAGQTVGQVAYSYHVCCPYYQSSSNVLVFYEPPGMQTNPQFPSQYPQYPTNQQFPINPQYPTYPTYPQQIPFQGLRQANSGDSLQCGITNATFTRVVGGQDAPVGAWPWIALLGYNSTSRGLVFLCAGSLITQRHVLSAAHCIQDALYLIRLGEHDLSSTTDGVVQDIQIDKKTVHPDFQSKNIVNDIAVLRLAQPATLNDRVALVCLPTEMNLREKDLTDYQPFVAGWGATYYRGASANILQQAQIPILPLSSCDNYKTSFPTLIFDDRIICAGWPSGGRDSCTGDSGAGLYLPQLSNDQTFYFYNIIGIVSYGYECALPGFPGVYTRVTSFLSWINDNLDG